MEINNEVVGKVIEGYKVVKFLGRGKFSTVYQAERQKDAKLVALKIIKIFDMMDQKEREKCLQEVKLLQSVDHPNIVKYLDSFISDNELYIAIEWADKGDVKRFIKKNTQEGDKLDEMKIFDYTRQLAAALHHMHEKRIIHRDLKPANILIFSDGTFKLGDLGLGRYMSDETFKAFSKVGTPLYMSPEVIRNDGYDFKSDVWSLGCVVYELITFKSPFRTDEKISLYDLFKKINTGDYPKINEEKYANIIKLVDQMLKVNPDERIGLEEVIKVCEVALSQREEKPRIDTFIMMEDIMEKLRLINYENTFCKKFKRETINKYYFAWNCTNGKNVNVNANMNSTNSNIANNTYSPQFVYFYELSNWLMILIKQNVNLEILQEFDIKCKKFDKKRTVEAQLNDLFIDLKTLGVKIIENSKYQNGYGEGVCIILTHLLDKYLINQNYIFKKPKFGDSTYRIEEIQNDFEEIVLEENIPVNYNLYQTTGITSPNVLNTNTQNGFTGNNFRTTGSNGKFHSGCGKKRFNSAMSSTTQETNNSSAFSTEYDNFKVNPHTMILEPSIDPNEWKNELDRVEKLLAISEYPEFLISDSLSDSSNVNNNLCNIFAMAEGACRKLSVFASYLDQASVNSKLGENIRTVTGKIDDDLRKISSFENSLTNMKSVKLKLNEFSLKRRKSTDCTKQVEEMEATIESMTSQRDDLEGKLKSLKEKEDQLKSNSKKKDTLKIKSTIKALKDEIKSYELQNSLFTSHIFSYKILSSRNKEYRDVNNRDDIFSNDDVI